LKKLDRKVHHVCWGHFWHGVDVPRQFWREGWYHVNIWIMWCIMRVFEAVRSWPACLNLWRCSSVTTTDHLSITAWNDDEHTIVHRLTRPTHARWTYKHDKLHTNRISGTLLKCTRPQPPLPNLSTARLRNHIYRHSI